MDGCLKIHFGGTDLFLLPEHAAWCPATKTIWIADLHLGKEQTFRRSGIPIPDLLLHDLARLSRILEMTCVRKVYILGDLIHARNSWSSRLIETVTRWRSQHAAVEMILVRGNHDQRAGDPPESWQINCVHAPTPFGTMQLTHHPLFDNQSYNLAGHLHPKWRGHSHAKDLKLPCFLLRKQTLVLPAFGRFIDHGTIEPETADQFYVVVDGKVCHLISH